MHQTKKGNQWYFGMKAHRGGRRIGSGAQLGDDGRQRGGRDCVLLHGDETEAWGRGLPGCGQAPGEQGFAWQVAMKPEASPARSAEAAAEKRKASVRAKVEHPFRRFGYGKVRWGLAKNTQRIALLLGFSNLLIAGRYATG